jgi:hypothetical protein
MSDDPYFPNDEKRIEIRILLPLRGHAAPWEVAKTVMAGIDENATALFGNLEWYSAADLIDPKPGIYSSRVLSLVRDGVSG